MQTPNEASSLVALRELRDLDQGADLAQPRLDLEDARSQIARLRLELACAQQAQGEWPPRQRRLTWAQWSGWLGLSAGVTMLVGAFALWAATRPQEMPKLAGEAPFRACPEEPPLGERMPAPVAAGPAEPRAVSAPRPAPTWRRPPAPHPQAKPSLPTCDGRDPLCGLDLGAIDDEVGKKHGKLGGKKN
jgi:hypothetical protein